jgi:hypothetical protein
MRDACVEFLELHNKNPNNIQELINSNGAHLHLSGKLFVNVVKKFLLKFLRLLFILP